MNVEQAKHVLGMIAGRESGISTTTDQRNAARVILDVALAPAPVKLDVPHSAGGWHQWVFLGGWRSHPVQETRDAIGRRSPRAWRQWLVLSCNNADCPAVGLLRMDYVTDAMQAALPVPVEPSADAS